MAAADTYGATAGLPAYLTVVGEVAMGQATDLQLALGEAALVHTGGMVPAGADAVVMVEKTQPIDADSIEVLNPVAEGENVIQVGEDVRAGRSGPGGGSPVAPAGHRRAGGAGHHRDRGRHPAARGDPFHRR